MMLPTTCFQDRVHKTRYVGFYRVMAVNGGGNAVNGGGGDRYIVSPESDVDPASLATHV